MDHFTLDFFFFFWMKMRNIKLICPRVFLEILKMAHVSPQNLHVGTVNVLLHYWMLPSYSSCARESHPPNYTTYNQLLRIQGRFQNFELRGRFYYWLCMAVSTSDSTTQLLRFFFFFFFLVWVRTKLFLFRTF